MLSVKTKIKEIIKEKGMHTGAEVTEALDKIILSLLEKACQRAKANNRVTVYSRDL